MDEYGDKILKYKKSQGLNCEVFSVERDCCEPYAICVDCIDLPVGIKKRGYQTYHVTRAQAEKCADSFRRYNPKIIKTNI